MGSERILRDPPSPEVLAERVRVRDMLQVVIDDTIDRVGADDRPVARELLRAFAREFAGLRKAVREGATVEEFAAARTLPFAKEIDDDRSPAEAGAAEQR
jgi:hypothetical protein